MLSTVYYLTDYNAILKRIEDSLCIMALANWQLGVSLPFSVDILTLAALTCRATFGNGDRCL